MRWLHLGSMVSRKSHLRCLRAPACAANDRNGLFPRDTISKGSQLLPNSPRPRKLKRARRLRPGRCCPAHRAWVRRHRCSVPGCEARTIECAHVRIGTDGGQGLKPSDCWTISLCREHHSEQHHIGELAFEARYKLELKALAETFVRASPHREKLTR